MALRIEFATLQKIGERRKVQLTHKWACSNFAQTLNAPFCVEQSGLLFSGDATCFAERHANIH
jgi:hypothetical protein